MDSLQIKNFGAIKAASLKLKKVNVLIGPQSSGKSTILKVASFCKWIEKKIQLSQDPDEWLAPQVIKDQLLTFHKLEGYVNGAAEIVYKSKTLQFSITIEELGEIKTSFAWNKARHWDYLRTKISYIPADRNIVASIPNWMDINFGKFNNIREYMAEWESARKSYSKEKLDILGLGVSYYYDALQKKDKIVVGKKTLDFVNASSGLQSLVPQYALLSHLFDGLLYENLSVSRMQSNEFIKGVIAAEPSIKNKEDVTDRYVTSCGINVFLEEPEQNLFPKAQYELVKWLACELDGNPNNTLFMSTHSPYILSSINNLLQAEETSGQGTEAKNKVIKIMGQSDFVAFDDLSVYAIEKGRVKSLLDEESKLIDQTALDAVSLEISQEFSRLLDI